MSRHRITCITLDMGCGGTQHVMHVITKELTDAGHAVSLILADGSTSDFYEVDHRVHRTETLAPDRSVFHPLDLKSRFRRIQRLRKLILETQPDVVISFEDFLSVEVLISLSGCNIPVIVSEHNEPTKHKIPLRWRILRRIYYPKAHAVTVLNDSIHQWSKKIFLPWPSVVLPNPLEPAPPLATPPPWIGPRTIIGLGRLVHQKGFDILIDAFQQIADQAPEWELSILGDGPEFPKLTSQIQQSGLQKRIRLVGRVSSPRSILPHAGLFVMPSRYEAFGIVLIEAMDAGLPLISFNCPSSPKHIIENGKTGMLVDQIDAESLAKSMLNLLKDAETRTRLAQSAKQSALSYAPPAIMKRWDILINSAINRHESP